MFTNTASSKPRSGIANAHSRSPIVKELIPLSESPDQKHTETSSDRPKEKKKKITVPTYGQSGDCQFHHCFASTSTLFLWALFLVALTASYLSFQSFIDSGNCYFTASGGGIQWEKRVRDSAQVHRPDGLYVLVTGNAGFVGTHVSLALKKRGDGIVGLDNFNSYYDPSLLIFEI